MPKDRETLLSILRENTGFDDPERWVEYGERSGFQRVRATRIPRCPDCGGEPRRRWGQYVYYSTLIRLRECGRCGLIWADAHIDSAVIRQHFETTYKDDTYFRVSRHAIFSHLAGIIDALCPPGGRVLDIGGARGDLMSVVVARRPDLRPTVQDLSRGATEWAASRYGFETLTGDAESLAGHSGRYDVLVLSDVLYYEPRLPVLWAVLPRLLTPGGSVVIRVPNRALLVRAAQRWFELTRDPDSRYYQDGVRFYNPEHIFLFRKPYLRRRLRGLGFDRVRFLPSPLLGGRDGRQPAGATLSLAVARLLNAVSRRSLVLTPAMVVIARQGRG